MIVRPVKNTDIERLAQIYTDVFHVSYAPFLDNNYMNTVTVESAYKIWADKYADHTAKGNDCVMLAACCEANQCRGFLFAHKTDGAEKRDALMSTLYVDPKCQNQGFGSALLDQFKTWLITENLKTCRLGVLANNLPAKSFYTKHGFVNTLENKHIQRGEHSYTYEFFELTVRK